MIVTVVLGFYEVFKVERLAEKSTELGESIMKFLNTYNPVSAITYNKLAFEISAVRSRYILTTVLSTLFIIAFVSIAGCSNDDSSAKSPEPSNTSSDKWLDAWNVQQLYEAQIGMDAINAGENPSEADTSCAAILPMARKSLGDASNVGMPAQIMYKICNDAGLKFQNEVRCEADGLQVLCR